MMDHQREIERAELLRLLEHWQSGALNECDVHIRAEALIEEIGEFPPYPDDDPKSISSEVLFQLDTLNHQWITSQDIPAIREFLTTPQGREEQGWIAWRSYWKELDLEARRKELEGNTYYCT